MLFAMFLAYPIVFLQAQFLVVLLSPFASLGSFFLTLTLFSGVLAALTFNHVFGYIAVVGVIISDLAFGLPVFVFAPHVALVLAFVEGTVSLKPYQVIAKTVVRGEGESISSSISLCFSLLRRRLFTIFGTLFALSTAYGLLPTLLPTSTDILDLAIYVTIGLFVFGIIVLYLRSSE
jgi:hypothetical protein